MSRLRGLAGSSVPEDARSVQTIFTFEWLLDPIRVDEFLNTYWETEPLLIQRDDANHFAALPGLDDLDELITATTSGRTRSMDDGRLVKTDTGGVTSTREIPLGPEGSRTFSAFTARTAKATRSSSTACTADQARCRCYAAGSNVLCTIRSAPTST
jgi:hypothetical protein